jgi:hypothetical protein
MTDADETTGKRLRPEEWAAIANAVAVLSAPAILAAVSWLTEEPRAVVVAYTSTPPGPIAAFLSRVALLLAPMAPLAAIAGWRTHAHAGRMRRGHSGAWRGVVEAASLGALIPTIVLLPVVAMRGLAGLHYAAAYAVIGALVGLAFGVVLSAVAVVVVRLTMRLASKP